MRRAGAAVVTALLLSVVGCSSSSDAEPSPLSLDWREAALPLAAGVSGAPVVRDAVACGGAWFVVGGVRDAARVTSPAVWRAGADGVSWSPVSVAAESFYGKQNVLFSAACRDGRLVAVGDKPGGAHGNPRTSSWLLDGGGVLREVSARFELFGGPSAVNVSRLVAGPPGFLITGNRVSGAAVWSSADGSAFEVAEGVPGLASDASGVTWAADAVAVDGGWVVAGGLMPAGRPDRDPVGWRSSGDGVWRRLTAEGASGEYEELQRVALAGGVPVALGLRGSALGVWRLESDRWRPVGSFGSVSPSAWSGVRAVAVSGSRLVAAVGDGSAFGLWVSDDGGSGWRPLVSPRAVRGVSGSGLSVSAGPGLLVVSSDDGVSGRVFTAVSAT
ncbi:hypothetical protein GCM10025331_60900 [Actinoplanes utahensis]|uniref:Galactose oxidase n=1 Tax=Actinoplanes utahensis TaxID=1869 RepID=A0A0A6UNB6_ACTUT|nr:hypothetical protein MB27_09095 [Actinoplanes utahensis]GIF34673.1 hypothetical protein Aut01nite_76590 [Actinoplanes utahensis]